jgi:hypothetical protein
VKETCSVSSDRLCDNPCPEQACGCGREGGVQAVASTEKIHSRFRKQSLTPAASSRPGLRGLERYSSLRCPYENRHRSTYWVVVGSPQSRPRRAAAPPPSFASARVRGCIRRALKKHSHAIFHLITRQPTQRACARAHVIVFHVRTRPVLASHRIVRVVISLVLSGLGTGLVQQEREKDRRDTDIPDVGEG